MTEAHFTTDLEAAYSRRALAQQRLAVVLPVFLILALLVSAWLIRSSLHLQHQEAMAEIQARQAIAKTNQQTRLAEAQARVEEADDRRNATVLAAGIQSTAGVIQGSTKHLASVGSNVLDTLASHLPKSVSVNVGNETTNQSGGGASKQAPSTPSTSGTAGP
jgi:hypothetical protein